MGFDHGRYTKGVFVDGHERPDVIKYRNEVFIPQWQAIRHRLVIFNEDGSWHPPPGMLSNWNCGEL